MITDQTIIAINITCIIFLMLMMVVLVAATRMKGVAGYSALVVVTTTVPVYLANMMRTADVDIYVYMTSAQLAVFINCLCFPSLWLFVRCQLDKSFHLTFCSLLHVVPALISLLVSLAYYGPMSGTELTAEREFLETGNENLPAIINDIVVFGQFFIYFGCIFFYIRKREKYLRDNYSDSDYLTIRWMRSFLIMFFILFFIVFVAYMIDPRTDAWLIPVLNSVGMAYLVYIVIFHSMAAYINRLADTVDRVGDMTEQNSSVVSQGMDEEQMKENCRQITDYLLSTQAYRRCDLSLSMLSKEIGLPQKVLSRSINGYLNRNFFELINEMRVEEAKRRLLAPENSGYKIDGIYEECGFRTRSTFFLAFKKVLGQSPAQWLYSVKKHTDSINATAKKST